MKILSHASAKKKRKRLKGLNFALLLVVFKWHQGSEGIKQSLQFYFPWSWPCFPNIPPNILTLYTYLQQWSLPENNNESIKDVEAVADVPKGTIGKYLTGHLRGKENTEHYVAVLQYLSQLLRLYGNRKQIPCITGNYICITVCNDLKYIKYKVNNLSNCKQSLNYWTVQPLPKPKQLAHSLSLSGIHCWTNIPCK